jgi:hypothetical protein
MNYKYLDRVIDQIVSETEIDYDRKIVVHPFPYHRFFFPFNFFFLPFYTSSPPSFSQHCREVYVLNEDEIDYVWDTYRDVIDEDTNDT